MTDTEERILEVFRKHKTALNGILRPQSIDFRNWDRRSQDEFPSALEQLLKEDYISTKEGWYVLTDKGYNYIYRNYSIEGTKELILNVFRNHNVGKGEILMRNSFISLQNNTDRFHFDNFNGALQGLISDGLIEITSEGYYKLTQLGYDKIY